MNHTGHERGIGGLLRRPAGLVLLGFLAIGAFFLLTEHRAHLLGVSPLLLLLFLCPLMHLFMHHGHDHGGVPSRPTPADETIGRHVPTQHEHRGE